MPERFNILAFRKLFDIVKVDYKEREAEWRVFGNTAFCLADYAEKISSAAGETISAVRGESGERI